MSPETARKIVVAAAVVGSAAIIYQGGSQDFATSYKRVWGLLLLTAGGSVLADFAPQVVGPYMALVLIVFLVGTKNGLGNLFKTAAAQAGSSTGSSSSGANPAPPGPSGPIGG